jgi:type II secretory pathway pseudopilin PulG
MNKLNQNGYSMIELTVVLSIFIILLFMATEFIIQGLRSNTFAYEQDAAVSNARKVVDSLIKEVRKANQAETGVYLLETVGPQTFTFYSDIDGDNKTEKIRYYLDNRTFKKGVIKATGTLISYPAGDENITTIANYVNNGSTPIFQYYDKNNNLLADPGTFKRSIRMINISMMINVTPERAPADYFVRANIQIRNLKDNL